MDFRAQTFRGRPVLTWYEGTVLGPYGREFVIYDPRYRRVARVAAGRGRHGDLHEFLDVRRQPDGTITLFDNAAALPATDVSSRAVRLSLDLKKRHVTPVRAYKPSDPRAGWAMGNVQQLPDGGLFVGWGTDGSFSEFGPGGRLRFDARFAGGDVTYRAFRLPWTARPTGRPAAAAVRNDDGTATVYASWNGATEVTKWRVEAGTSADRLRPLATQPRTGFETAITVPARSGLVSVVALDASGRRLATAETIRL